MFKWYVLFKVLQKKCTKVASINLRGFVHLKEHVHIYFTSQIKHLQI